MKTTITFTFEIEIDGTKFTFSQLAESADEARLILIEKLEKIIVELKKSL